jgi:hypothetical protein
MMPVIASYRNIIYLSPAAAARRQPGVRGSLFLFAI